jgi:hypothetical protein
VANSYIFYITKENIFVVQKSFGYLRSSMNKLPDLFCCYFINNKFNGERVVCSKNWVLSRMK